MIPIPPQMIAPLIKAGVALAIVLAAYGLGQWHGRSAIQQEWDAAVMQQQLVAGEFIVKQGQETNRAATVHQEQIRQLAESNRSLAKKVRDYERSPVPQCSLSPEFESVFDSISRMREPAPNGVPPTAEPPGVAHATPEARPTDAAVLPAYHHAVSQLYACTDQLSTLQEWERNSKQIATEGAGR